MKKRTLGIILAGVAYALSVYASGPTITDDDLERKYPSDPPTENEAYLQQEVRLKHEAECEELKQLTAQARKAIYAETDPSYKQQRHEQFYRYQSAYQKKCQAQQ